MSEKSNKFSSFKNNVGKNPKRNETNAFQSTAAKAADTIGD